MPQAALVYAQHFGEQEDGKDFSLPDRLFVSYIIVICPCQSTCLWTKYTRDSAYFSGRTN